jgi:uncharacterized protein (TIGR03067 family)
MVKEVPLKTAMWLSACAILLAAGSFGASGQGKDDKFDATKLVGTWKYVSGVKEGQKLDADHFKGQTVVLTKDTFTLKSSDATFVMKYKLDTKAKPIAVAMEIAEGPVGVGAKSAGIIELNGDDLKICYAIDDGAAPKTFESKEGSKYHLFVLKRTK